MQPHHIYQRKRLYGVLIAGLLLICLFAAGCTSQPTGEGTPTAATTPAAENYISNETQNNATVTLSVGSRITITLDENPTTGYRWNVTSSAGLQYVNETFIAPETEVVGAGGVHRWQYVAAEPGSAEFTAIYRRPWEEATGNETTFSTDFIIR